MFCLELFDPISFLHSVTSTHRMCSDMKTSCVVVDIWLLKFTDLRTQSAVSTSMTAFVERLKTLLAAHCAVHVIQTLWPTLCMFRENVENPQTCHVIFKEKRRRSCQ